MKNTYYTKTTKLWIISSAVLSIKTVEFFEFFKFLKIFNNLDQFLEEILPKHIVKKRKNNEIKRLGINQSFVNRFPSIFITIQRQIFF